MLYKFGVGTLKEPMCLKTGLIWLKPRKLSWLAIIILLNGLVVKGSLADPLDQEEDISEALNNGLMDVYGRRWQTKIWERTEINRKSFASELNSKEARKIWLTPLRPPGANKIEAARNLGLLQGRLQQVLALEMLHQVEAGNMEAAREWRSAIAIPKYANAKEGILALQNGSEKAKDKVILILAHEYINWDVTRIREKLHSLEQLLTAGRGNPALVAARVSEIYALADLPHSIKVLDASSFPKAEFAQRQFEETYHFLQAHVGVSQSELLKSLQAWQAQFETTAPNLLDAKEIARQEQMAVKILPKAYQEYRNGVIDGKIMVSVEYREALGLFAQLRTIFVALLPAWRERNPEFVQRNGKQLWGSFETIELAVKNKQDARPLGKQVADLARLFAAGVRAPAQVVSAQKE